MSNHKTIWSLWGVELEGDNLSIERIAKSLNQMLSGEEDTFISCLNSTAALRSAKWNNIEEPKIILQTAQLELDLLQGLAKMSGGTGPLTLGTIFKFDHDNEIISQSRVVTGTILSLARVFEADLFSQRLASLRQNEPLHDAVLELCGIADWYRIYKVIEYLEEHFAGGERGLLEALPCERAVLKNIKKTSQSLRHRARAFAEIRDPITLEEAEKNLVRIVKELIDNKLLSSGNEKPSFIVPYHAYPEDFVIGIKPPKNEALLVGIGGDPICMSEKPKL